LVTPREVRVAPFALDAFELTWHRIERCWSDGLCSALGIAAPQEPPEPGLPVTNLSVEQAAGLCAAVGGRLPSADEWLFAAAGSQARRYPWGNTGLVCRRAAFGLASGPCARDALTPDLAGARPDGSSPDGVQDLAGNVAEWTARPAGYAARGGSFRSSLAGRLKSWAAESPRGPLDEIGVRCAYDHR
jgi:formylglycine-generating enzyme required for sulfatase activity